MPAFSTCIEEMVSTRGTPNPHMTPLLEAIMRLGCMWADAEKSADLSREELLGAHRAVDEVQRCLGGLHAELAATIAPESRPELGSVAHDVRARR